MKKGTFYLLIIILTATLIYNIFSKVEDREDQDSSEIKEEYIPYQVMETVRSTRYIG